MKAIDLTGRVFERLTVIGLEGCRPSSSGTSKRIYRCRCECGKEITTSSSSLLGGHSGSCGCLGRDRRRAANTKHGQAPRGHVTVEYRTWLDMLDRCRRVGHISYPNYGARGITVCERWMMFENFVADMGLRPWGGSIDRIDPNGNYEPSNCRWLPRSEQNRNKRTNHVIEIDGERAILAVWVQRSPASLATIIRRLAAGWSPKAAVFTAPGPQGRHL